MAGMKNDLISVIIPTYNDDEYLPRAVESVLSQAYDPVEIFLVDSADSAVAADFANERECIEYLRTPPNGPGAARNVGIDAAAGEYIAFLDADDEWLEGKLRRQISKLEDTGADFVFSEEYQITEAGEREHLKGITFPDDEPAHEYYFRKGTGIGSRTVVVRHGCVAERRFDEELAAREDPHLWTRILRDHKPAKVDEPLAIKHYRPDSLTADLDLVWKNERQSIKKLADAFNELEQYRDDRLTEADYRYAKRLLQDGRNKRARQILTRIQNSDDTDPRILALLAISYLPFAHRTAIDRLNTAYQYVA